jgi:uncharacterized protein with GYD domain
MPSFSKSGSVLSEKFSSVTQKEFYCTNGSNAVTATRRYFGEWTTSECRETSMTIYISQGRYTAAAIKGMSAKPEDRSEAVAELFAAAGARLISWYLTLGPYDWLIIAEAPDEPTMISAVLAAAAGGSLSDITTTVALTASDTAKAFQRAGELTLKFRSAGRADYYGVGIESGREIGEA